MPSVDSERPFDRWNNDLNVFTAGGVADGDGSRQADLKGLQTPECLRFLIEREEDWNPWTGEPSPSRSHDRMVYVNAVADLLFVDIQLWFPPADMVNVDVRENIPMVCFVGLSAGGKSFSRVARI